MKLQTIVILVLGFLFTGLVTPLHAHGGSYRGPRIPRIPSIPTGPPAGNPTRGGSGRTATLDVRKWEEWWAFNKDEFFPIRGVQLVATTDPKYDQSNRLPNRKEVRELIIPVLLEALKHRDKEIRNSAAIALGRVGEEPELATLVGLLDDKERSVIEAAIIGLGLLKCAPAEDKLISLISVPRRPARQRGLAMMALGLSGGEKAREFLHKNLGKPRNGPRERVAQLASLQAMAAGLVGGSDLPGSKADDGNPATGFLVAGIRAARVKERFFIPTAYVALSKVRDSAAERQVLAGLKHKKSEVRAGAAIAVGRVFRTPSPKTLKKLGRILDAERDRFTRRLLMISLGRIGGDGARKILAKNLRHKDRQHRAFATLGLAISGDTSRIPEYRKALKTEGDHSLKGLYGIALGLLKDQEAAPLIVEQIKANKNPELRAHLVQALLLVGDRTKTKTIEMVMAKARVPGLQAAAALSLGLLGGKASLDLLLEMMSRARTISVKGAIATGLGRQGGYALIEDVVKLVRNDGEQDLSRAFGCIALGILGEKTPTLSPFSRVSIDSQYNLHVEVLGELRDLL